MAQPIEKIFFATLATIFLSTELNAQEAVQEKPERISVTGSHIKRIDIEGPSPLTTIDSEAFEQAGNVTLEDMLRDSPYFESVEEGGNRSGYVRFRGQHAGNTLILLNGMRMPKEEGTFFTSISYVPTSVIDRIELMRDGGSATYGSDAMAGVVNFITKKNVQGGQFSTSLSGAETGLGLEQNYQVGYGGTMGRSTYLVGTQYRNLSPYTESQLGSYVRNSRNISASNTPTSYSLRSANGTSQVFGAVDCPDAQRGRVCRTNPLSVTEDRSQAQDLGGMLTVSVPIDRKTEVNFLTILSRKDEIRNRPSGFVNLDQLPGSSLSTREQLGILSTENVGLQFVSDSEVGIDTRNRVANMANVQAMVSRDFAASWNWSLQTSLSVQDIEERSISGNINRQILQSSAQAGLFDVTDPVSRQAGLQMAATDPTRRIDGQMINARFVTAGELGTVGPALVSLAVGADFEYETSQFNHDQEIVSGQSSVFFAQSNFLAQRRVNSLFTELTAISGQLEMQMAGRFDSYDQFGSTLNPKIGLSYRPHRTVLMRGSYGRGFKPPGLSDTFTPAFNRLDSYADLVQCEKNGVSASACNRQTDEVNVVRNPLISFETSTSSSVGVVWQPTEGLDVAIDQWNFAGRGTISNFTARNAIDFEKQFGSTTPIENVGAQIIRDPVTGEITSIQLPNIFNRDAKWLSGVDLSVNYNADLNIATRGLRLTANTTTSHIFDRRERQFAFSPIQTFDDYGTQNNTSLAVSSRQQTVRVAARSLLNGDLNSSINNWDYPPYTEFDLTYTYRFQQFGDVTVAARNFMDTVPPYDQNADVIYWGGGSSLYSPLGRRFFVSYNTTF